MSIYVAPQSYLDTFSRLYTDAFVAEGGAVVRAALGDSGAREALRAGLQVDAESKKYVYAHVDSSVTKIQKLEDVFFAISAKINWASTSRRWVRRVLMEQFKVDDSDLTLNGLCSANNGEPFAIRRRVEDLIASKLLRRPGLCGEFKRAAFQLVWTVLEPHSLRAAANPFVIDWLRGNLDRIAPVKPALIYRKIGKTNARQMLASLSRWLRDCDYGGSVVTMDLGEVTALPRFALGRRYSRPALIDVYEVLRQFVDMMDDIEGLALVVLAEEAFADDEKRGTYIYPALRTRLSDDVWDASRPNPMAPMVRLGG